ncbi:phosphoribosylglycinamide formyltransferase [Clostridium cellulovorans]|uniref:Phosphoribosylglycinamide formyltransferase n=1 Tax=Clostridium cellulovorans (strain ATCC 35296 / DSM 3052 / OCM 3 / 743B) TaxID=573061 RepID=D9SX01_CLOC7|nr:phosphoribosylglycinamide formyltransferase [Clostridium cellulovorans]ADL51362.1 phosphoribosylglycinamide formyltransferase [Clostridium cellulovorans 743B]
MFKIAVLASGGGTNLQAIIDAVNNKEINAEISYIITDNEKAYALERGRLNNIPVMSFDRKQYKEGLSDKILEVLKGKADIIVLAGYLSILQGDIIKEFKNRIINIHPSLIPSFCGMGAYGIKVHEMAIEYGVKVSGCTVHFVDEGTDTGAIILQKVVEVMEGDDAKKLQERILVKEHEAIVEAVKLFSEERVQIDGRKVSIKG